ncbi:MAG: MFS transporter [Bacillota bacterium]|nr:MFS transporter [Bacillota bacterium]
MYQNTTGRIRSLQMEQAIDQAREKKRLLAGCMYFFLVNGALVLMTSSLLVFLMQDYHLSYDQGGLLLTTQAVGSITTSFLSGPLSIWIGRKRTLLLAAFGFCISFLLITLMPPLPILLLALFLSGLAWGISNNLVNFLVVRATDGNSSQISRVHTVFSIGGFLAPLLVALAVRLDLSWRWPAAVIAVLSLGLIVYTRFMPVPESKKRTGDKKPVSLTFLKKWRLYLFMTMLFLYVGIEVGFSGWLVTYLTTWRNLEASLAQTLLSTLWIAMIVGRIITSIFGQYYRKDRFLLLEAIGISASALLLILAIQPGWLVVAVVLLGLSMSAFYGMVVANASWLVAESTIASGLLMSLGGLGASLMPLIAGIYADSSGIAAGL